MQLYSVSLRDLLLIQTYKGLQKSCINYHGKKSHRKRSDQPKLIKFVTLLHGHLDGVENQVEKS